MENFTRYYYTDTNCLPQLSMALFAAGTSFTAQGQSHTTDIFQWQIINLRKKMKQIYIHMYVPFTLEFDLRKTGHKSSATSEAITSEHVQWKSFIPLRSTSAMPAISSRIQTLNSSLFRVLVTYTPPFR